MKYRSNNLLESLERNLRNDIRFRRYSLSDIVSESYGLLYKCEDNSNLRKLVESHLENVRSNPTEIDTLSRHLCVLKEMMKLTECGDLSDSDFAEKSPVRRRPMRRPAPQKEVVEEAQDTDELTDEEVEALSTYLEELRNGKKPVTECDEPEKKEVSESSKGRKLMRRTGMREGRKLMRRVVESKNEDINLTESLSNFSKNSSTKAFYKTFKKMSKDLHEGRALTRQESINLYKAANSALTHMSVELEKNPEFLVSFKECSAILAKSVNDILGALQEGKGPSKRTMKSLAEFADSILKKKDCALDEEDEIEDADLDAEIDFEEEIPEEEIELSPEAEEAYQEYIDARVELHKELVDEYGESVNDDEDISSMIAQDGKEVLSIPGITEDQVEEVAGKSEEEGEESPEDEEENPEEEDVEEDSDITEDELAELKRHLKEMRANRK